MYVIIFMYYVLISEAMIRAFFYLKLIFSNSTQWCYYCLNGCKKVYKIIRIIGAKITIHNGNTYISVTNCVIFTFIFHVTL